MKTKMVAAALLGSALIMNVQQVYAVSPETEMLLNFMQTKGVLTEKDVKEFRDTLRKKISHMKQEEDQDQRGMQGLDQKLERQEKASKEGIGLIGDRLQLSGLVEVEASSSEDYNNEASSDITLSTVEIGLDAHISKWVDSYILFLYEEGEESDSVIIDEGIITLANSDKFPAYLSVGKMYVPFGFFETHMVSDPLTLEIGETNDTAMQIGFETKGFYGSLYGFNGDISERGDEAEVDSYGANFGYSAENDTMALDIGVGWMSNIADTDGIGDYLSDEAGTDEVDDYVDGFSLHATVSKGPFSLIGEYVTAMDEFGNDEISIDGKGAKPASWNIEAAYTNEFFSRLTTVALGYQASREAITLGLPEERYVGTISLDILDNTSLAFEYHHDEDYDESDEGTEENANSVTMQLAVGF